MNENENKNEANEIRVCSCCKKRGECECYNCYESYGVWFHADGKPN